MYSLDLNIDMIGIASESVTTSSSQDSVIAVGDFLDSISREGLCVLASRLNHDIRCFYDLPCCVPTFGTFNVIIPLVFENGEKWIARIPRPGRMFKDPNPDFLGRFMHSLVVTTAVVRERTSIPVPEIHGWSPRDDNIAGCPYMFMDFVEGVSLGDCFQDLSPEKTTSIIYEWAMYTWELTRLTFPAIGCLGLKQDTKRLVVQEFISAGSLGQGRDENLNGRGPYTSVADYLFGISNLKKMVPLDGSSYDRFSFSTYIETLIPFALKPQWNDGPFCLAHDDFNVQNILINPETGRITAVLDWDYAAVKPIQSLLSYPESLRWDLLAPVNSSFSSHQVDWAQTYRRQWAEAMLLASKNIPTGCHANVVDFLDDSPFYAELERGLGEAWRESEALKFCSAMVYGGYSPAVLKIAGHGVRTGPWMGVYGMRSGYMVPADLETRHSANLRTKSTQIISASPISLDRAERSSVLGRNWVGPSFNGTRRRIRKTLGRVCASWGSNRDSSGDLEKPAVWKGRGWWAMTGRRFYGVRERTMVLD
jgi:hypothetical protein